jgi:hypothetical protein
MFCYSGLPSLVDFLEPDFSEFKDLIYNSLDAIWNIFELQTPTPKRAFCYLFVKSGLLSRLSVVLVNLAKYQAQDPEADSYVQTVVKILLFFSKSDAQVTEKMCATDVLQRKYLFPFLESPRASLRPDNFTIFFFEISFGRALFN